MQPRFRDATLDDVPAIDAFEGKAGAGGLYARCGYQGRGQVVYRGISLVYYELLLR